MQSNNRKEEKMYAHIFKARQKGQWELIISRSAAITNDQVISSNIYPNKNEAKKTAKVLGAIPHNY